MKHSIKRQMIAVFLGLLLTFVAALFIINIYFLEPYYIGNKKTQFIEMYEKLNQAIRDGMLRNGILKEEVSRELAYLAEKNNISFLIADDRGGYLTNVHDKEQLNNQLLGYLLNQAQKDSKILDSTQDYQIAKSWNPWNHTDYIEMWGALEDESQFLLRSPVEGIKESAKISNRFLLSIGSILIVISVVSVWYFSKRMTDPILELAVLSEQMANLDFNARYESGGSDEIGELGANFNRMSEKLESTISELKGANNRLKEDIEQKEQLEKMRNEFLGNVSHELKTPIALIQGYAEGLREGVSDDQESREFYCDVIIDEAAKMNQMVKNLLALNQLEFGDQDIVFERFDLTELIRGVLQSMEILAEQEGIHVIFRQEKPVYVWADEFKVEQVVRNYISNAFHHAGEEKVVEIRLQTADGKARATVFNTGRPIADEDIGHIWEKFYKADKAHSREYGGNGIGLSIVKAVMESFHQEYGVNNYDNGVEFWFELDIQ
ncbi:MAG: HAMP domain-containing protein [Dorea sp.]|nr:HAMP domain-containing protein [Dorea sp.]